ncbi:hypothetical protein ITP53_26915 [Nonomuraea sp. K274]|uniref:DUF4149 domain-containing protein n=1 Tax=Nonomuraea cypriaca TaxID=1187855 RepID=A0A931ACY5_9ACTN|nr:hypothetical protein [Nonomuraea cypriaca]MBF8189300.1 hypothetical protein [Nonomuraea cypriaca]
MITETGTAARPRDDGPPPVVHSAVMLWLSAVAFGAFEAVLMIGRELSADAAALAGLLPGAGFRLAVFAGAVFLALRMRRGANWARLTLAAGLGVFGTLSLVIEPVRWLLDGGSIGAAVAGAQALDWVFASSRILHLAAVLGAVTLMFQPRANTWFRSA